MKQSTFDLYRCSCDLWKDKSWTSALEIRIGAAQEAMKYYARMAKHTHHTSAEYRLMTKKFKKSEDAVKWNQQMLKECYESN